MDKKTIQDLWLGSNIAFVLNYTLLILNLFVAFPVPRLPSIFNSLFLIFAYTLTFHSLFINLKSQSFNSLIFKIISQPNTFCIGFFITFPPNILLAPFFLLSIYHITSAVLSRKKEFEIYFFYEICIVLGKHLTFIGRLALLIELFLSPICFILVLFRKISFFTLISYICMVRKQCQSNKVMKDIFEECMLNVHSVLLKLPDNYKAMYLQILNRINSLFKKEDVKEKTE